jgi:hypothetical protein
VIVNNTHGSIKNTHKLTSLPKKIIKTKQLDDKWEYYDHAGEMGAVSTAFNCLTYRDPGELEMKQSKLPYMTSKVNEFS